VRLSQVHIALPKDLIPASSSLQKQDSAPTKKNMTDLDVVAWFLGGAASTRVEYCLRKYFLAVLVFSVFELPSA
jgi:hypothetical protein